jgi:putative phage-type endonuclease
MAKKAVSTKGLSKQEWLAERQKGIGSSDVGAIIGVNKYKTAFDVYEEKVSDTPVEIPDNDAMEIGRELEEFVAHMYEKRTGRKVKRDNKIRVNPERPFMLASLDRVIEPPDNKPTMGVLEIKTVVGRVYDSWDGVVPPTYYSQVQHQLYVTGWSWAEMAVFILDRRQLIVIPIERDEEFIKAQVDLCDDFWSNHVQKRVAPEMAVKNLEKADPTKDSAIEATDAVVEAFSKLRAAKTQIDELKEAAEGQEAIIKEHMKLSERLMCRGTTLATWTKGDNTFDSSAFRRENSELYEKYRTKPGPRRFTVKDVEL